MNENREVAKALWRGKVVHGSFLATPLVYAPILMRLPDGFDYPFAPDDPTLRMITIALAMVGVAGLIVAQYWPRLAVAGASRRGLTDAQTVTAILLGRPAFYSGISIYGLVLAVMGAHQAVFWSFLGVGFVALVLTFPREKSIRDLLRRPSVTD